MGLAPLGLSGSTTGGCARTPGAPSTALSSFPRNFHMPTWLSWGHPWSVTPSEKPLTPQGLPHCPRNGELPKVIREKAEAGEKEGGFTLSHQSSRGVCISSLLTHLGKVPGFTPSSETQGWACARELGAGGHLTEGGQGLQAAKEASYRLGPSSCSQLWTLT